MNQTPRRYRRGDMSPERPGLIYWCFNHTYEEWVTPEVFTQRKAREKELYELKKGRQMARHKERYHSDPEYRQKHIDAGKKYNKAHPEKTKRAMGKWMAKEGSREKARAATAAWVSTPEGRIKRREISTRHRATPQGKIANRVRSRIWHALENGCKKAARTEKLIGCSLASFRGHLESQFVPGMSWENMGEWHIDHIIPLAMFRLEDPEHQFLAFNFKNQRPLWGPDNKTKLDFITHEGKQIRARELRGKIIPFQIQAA